MSSAPQEPYRPIPSVSGHESLPPKAASFSCNPRPAWNIWVFSPAISPASLRIFSGSARGLCERAFNSSFLVCSCFRRGSIAVRCSANNLSTSFRWSAVRGTLYPLSGRRVICGAASAASVVPRNSTDRINPDANLFIPTVSPYQTCLDC